MRNKENARKLTDIEVTAIAFTEAPANKRRFLLFKGDAGGGDKVMPDEKDTKTQGTVSAEALEELLSTASRRKAQYSRPRTRSSFSLSSTCSRGL